MKELPCLEEIYDFETEQLESILSQINEALLSNGQCELPKGIDNYEKFERKAIKLKEYLELELDERKQVDNVINFFVNQSTKNNIDFLNDDQFYKPVVQSHPQQFQQNEYQHSQIKEGQEESKSLVNTARDSYSLEGSSNQVDSESLTDQSEFSSTKQSNYSFKSKKDLQQFMKEKLAKTKIASESVGQSSSMGPSQKNFVKKKTITSQKNQEQTQYSTQQQKTNIYKPNIKRPQSQSKISGKQVKPQQKVQEKQVKQEIKQSVKNESQKTSIYKPPSMPNKKVQNQVKTEKNIKQQQKDKELNKEVIKTEIKESNETKNQEIENNEEIESQYYDYDTLPDQIIKQSKTYSEQYNVKEEISQVEIQQKMQSCQLVEGKKEELVLQQNDMNQPKNMKCNVELQNKDTSFKNDVIQQELNYITETQQILQNITDDQQILDLNVKEQEVSDKQDLRSQDGDFQQEKLQSIENYTQKLEKQEEYPQQQLNELVQSQDCAQQKSQQKIFDSETKEVQSKQQEKPKSLLQRLKERDPEKIKQEQEERLKKIRDDMELEKQEKQKQQIENQTKINTEQTQQQQDILNQTKETKVEQNSNQNKPQTGQTNKEKQKKQKNTIAQVQKYQLDGDCIVDYTNHYKSFYEIFVGYTIDSKNFDINFAMREARNMYATFVNIMDSNALQLRKKHVFDQAPTEKSYQDYYKAIPNQFMLSGKNIHDLELEMKNKSNEIMMQAMTQVELRENFQKLKQKDVNDIIKEANEKAKNNNQNSLIDMNKESSLYYRVIKNRSEVYDIISRAFSRKKRWNELPHGLDLRNSWNLLWSWSKIKIDITRLLCWQRCNHFNGAKNVSRKDFLKRNIERAQKMSQKASNVFNILPLTFVLPKEYVGFLESFSEYEDKEGKLNYWIMKPAAKSRGRGIQMINDLSCVIYGEPIVIQRYIKNPLLVDGYKFDLRIYVLVTSVNPLEIFIYKEGFGRFSTMPYSLNPYDKSNKYIHLTNVSIQKNNVHNSEQNPTDLLYGGTKVSLQTIKQRVQESNNVNWDEQIWTQIKEVVVKSLVACQNDIQYNPACFELFGFDIMIDEQYKCWLIEINSSPSLARDTLLDDMIKQRLIDDTIDLLDPIDFDRKRLFDVLERRVNDDFKQTTSSNAYNKKTMNRDLTYILNGKLPRKYEEMPKLLGNYERIAPSPQSEQYLKLIGGQKMFGSLMKINSQNVTN